jgi:hypothetical protein
MRNSLCASNFMDLRKRKRQPASTPGVHPPMTAPTNKPYLRGVSRSVTAITKCRSRRLEWARSQRKRARDKAGNF